MGPHRWQDIYFRHLSSHGHGYALLKPGPKMVGTESQPHSKQLYEEGLRVGDVGMIKDTGHFVTIFNIFQESGTPVNSVYGVPNGFQPLGFHQNLLFSDEDPTHPPNTWIYSEKAYEVKLNADGQALALGAFGPGLGVEILFERSHGSILSLPEGAHQVDYDGLPDIREYVTKHAESWYRFLTDEVRMDAYNGCLYVITGYDRASCYENLSFQSSSKKASLSFRFSFLPTGDLGKLGFSFSSVSPSEHRVGASGPDHTLNNLSPFIRGFKIMLRTGLTKLKAPIKIVDIARADPKNVVFRGSLPSRPNSSIQSPTSSSSSGNGSSSPSDASQLSMLTESNSDTSLDSSDMEVDSASSFSERGSSILDSDSEESVNWPYHPLDVINKYMLDMCPDTHVAISHDQDWISVVHGLNGKLSDDATLMELITEKYLTSCNDGCTYLMIKNHESQTAYPSPNFKSPITKPKVATTQLQQYAIHPLPGIGWHGLSSSSSEMILEQPNSTPFREDDWFSFSGLMGSSTHSRPNHESNSNYSSNPSSLNSDSNPYSSSSDYSSNPSSVSSDFDPFSSVDPSPLIYNPSPGLIYGPSPLSYDPSPLSSDFNHFNAVDPSLLNHSFDPASIFDNEYHSLFSSDSDFPTSVDPSHHKSKQKRQLDHDSEVPQVEYSVKRLKSEQGFTTSHVPKRHNVEKNSEAQESKSEPVASGSSNAGIHYTDYTYTDREGKIRKEKPKENM